MAVAQKKSQLSVVLVDVNREVVQAWKAAFADTPEVRIVRGSILVQPVDAWVTPTNSRGSMDGGLDARIKRHFGPAIEKSVRQEIERLYGGSMPVGAATCVRTGADWPHFLLSTPTMVRSAEDVSDTLNVALACAAAFQAIHLQNTREAGSIASVALPGLGAATGRVPPRVCANLMWTGYTLFNDQAFPDFAAMRDALAKQLGGLGTLPETAKVRIKTLSGGEPPVEPDTPYVYYQ